MKKCILFLLLLLTPCIYGAGVYFTEPADNGQIYYLGPTGAAFNFQMAPISGFYQIDWHGARIKYPDGHYSAWQDGPSGGWVVSQAGTYYLEGAAHVTVDLNRRTDYYIYSNTLYFNVIARPSIYLAGPIEIEPFVNNTWTAYVSNGKPPYTYNWSLYYPCEVYLKSGNSSQNGISFPDAPPCDYWFDIKATTSSITRYDSRNHTIYCSITDALGNTTSTTRDISIIGLSKNAAEYGGYSDDNFDITEYSLGQNYPNPFNPSTTIKYSLKEDSYIKLSVYNALGKEVEVLVNEFQNKGHHHIDFNGSNYASGIYVYRISTKNFNMMRKMVIAK